MPKASTPPSKTSPFLAAPLVFARCFLSLFLLTLSLTAHAGLTYITNNEAITITGYSGIVANLNIPKTIGGMTVEAIGTNAFSNQSFLKSVTIPNSVTSIGNNSFASCDILTNVTIGTNVIRIGDSAFASCTKLTGVTIPNGVTSIGHSAFFDCYRLRNITIPKSVLTIGNSAFAGTALEAFSVDEANSFFSSLSGVLFNKSQNTLIQYPCSRLGSPYIIPNSVTIIANSAFHGCLRLEKVTIPNSVISIGDSAFARCDRLSSVIIPNSVTTIGDSAFASCSQLMGVGIANGVTSIGSSAFLDCFKLSGVTIPNSVTTIGDSAFHGCLILSSLTIPSSLTSIENNAFSSCPGLMSVIIPSSVITIGGSAFARCSNLRSVTIPNSVTSIGDRAFSGSGLTSVVIPDSVNNIGPSAFYDCFWLTAISVDKANPSFSSMGGVLFNKGQTELIQYPISREGASYTIPNSVISIGDSAFARCDRLSSVIIPNTVTTIGDSSFSGCSGLTSVTIGNSVTTIGDRALAFCNNLTVAYFGGDQTPVPFGLFDGASPTVYYLPGTTGWGSTYAGRPAVLWNPTAPTEDQGFGVIEGKFGFNITGTPDISVVVEACSDLANPIWLPMSTNTLTGGSSLFSDPDWANHPSRVYRFRSP